jgi:ABC-type transport system substrate-binding protein
MATYWDKAMHRRLGRRRALVAAGGFAGAAAFLAACGGGDDDGPDSGDRSGLLTTPTDTTNDAKPGGVWVNHILTAADTYEPVAAIGSVGFTHTMPVYSKLAKFGKGSDQQLPTTDMITGDAAESWEVSPDSLRYALKLRRNRKFDPRPPTNGRVMTSKDLEYSMARFEGGSAFRGEILHKVFPTGMVDSMSYPDDYTAIIQLAYPYGPFPDVMAYYPYFNIMPVEAESGFDARSEMRGSGPFRLTQFDPDVRLVYEKNPDWYERGRPFLDGMQQQIIPEYAAALAQFEAGGLWTFPSLRQEDVLSVKQRHSDLVLARDLSLIKAPQFQFFQFSMKPNMPFRDVRLRRAISMLIDRDAIIETFNNIPQFRDVGLPIEGLWNSHHFALQPNWIDPKDHAQELGEGGKFFQHNPAEARKLVEAANLVGTSFPFQYQTGAMAAQYEVVGTMIKDGGFLNPEIQVIDSPTHRRFQASAGFGFDGMWPQTNGGHNEESWFLNMYHPQGKFTISSEPIPQISDMTLAIRREPDLNRQAGMIRDLQGKLAMEMPNILMPGYAIGFSLHQPWLKNYQVFVSGDLNPNWSSARIYTEYWYDNTAHRTRA